MLYVILLFFEWKVIRVLDFDMEIWFKFGIVVYRFGDFGLFV